MLVKHSARARKGLRRVADERNSRPHDGDATEQSRAARGAELLTRLPREVPDEPGLAEALDEIPIRFGVTFLSPIFQALSHWPQFLVEAWRAYAPFVDSPRYRRAVERIAAPVAMLGVPVPAVRRPPIERRDALSAYLDLQRSLLPELLLLATAWYGAGSGTPGTHATASAVLPRPVRTAALPQAQGDPAIEAVFAELAGRHNHPRVLSVYRAIGSERGFLLAAAPALLDAIATPGYTSARHHLLDASRYAAEELAMPAVRCDDEGPLEILALFRNRMIPALILDTTLMTAMLAADIEGDD